MTMPVTLKHLHLSESLSVCLSAENQVSDDTSASHLKTSPSLSLFVEN